MRHESCVLARFLTDLQRIVAEMMDETVCQEGDVRVMPSGRPLNATARSQFDPQTHVESPFIVAFNAAPLGTALLGRFPDRSEEMSHSARSPLAKSPLFHDFSPW
jgi:hypothetical protein